METKVCCPECNHKFTIEIDELLASNVEKEVKAKFEAEYKKKMKIVEKTELDMEELKKKMATVHEDAELKAMKKLSAKEDEIKADAEKRAKEKATLELEDAKRKLKGKEDDMDLELKRRVKEEGDKIREDEHMKLREYEKKFSDQQILLEEMQRKAGQGSMQLQGDVQEMAIGEWLRATFPLDAIEDIKTGARGADLFQTVHSRTTQNCGSIYYESKRTKDFQKSWIEKFKGDMRARNATFGVLVTDVMPEEMDRLGQKDGIWICTFTEFKGLCQALREAVVMLGESRASGENKGEKMSLLYGYLTSSEFRFQIEAIVEGFTQMQTDLVKEKTAIEGLWKKREKQIEKVVLNTTHMYGSIKGIAGNAIGTIQALELAEGKS